MCLGSCKQNNQKALFKQVENSNIQFTNTLVESPEFNVFKYRNFYNGGGVAIGDLNNDGLPEVFFTANQGANKLYLNKGNLQFEDISEKTGFGNKKQWSTGVVFVDINADGWLDIYVCNAGNMLDKPLRKNQLYINNHNLSFTEEAAKYGLDNDGYSTQASFFDYDLDGDLDCFLVNNSPIPVNTLNYANMRSIPDAEAPFAPFLKGGGDHLFKNDNGHFVDVTKEAGIHGSIISFGLGVTVGDINQDGYPDVYVSNDFFEKDYLYINQKNGTFKDEIEQRMQHISFSSMGADMQDINNDGKPDIFTTDMLPGDDYRLKTNTSFEGYDIFKLKQNQGFYNQFTQNALQVNNGEGKFLESAFYSGVAASDWSWGALMFDANNDGLADIFVCNGIYRDVTDQDFIDFFANDIVKQMALTGKKEEVGNVIDKMPSVPIPNKAFQNRGNLKFSDEGMNWGFDKPTFSNGASYADLDNDGDLDLIISNVNQPALVYQNNSREQSKTNYIALSLKYKAPNTFAIGSTVKIFHGKDIIYRELMPSKGFQSSVDYKLTIGLGKMQPDSMQIIWPDRSISTILKPAINQLYSIDYATASAKQMKQVMQVPIPTYFTALKMPFEKHTEDDYVDFYAERNIPFMLSKQGPKAAVADVNGDGLDDIYIGGALQQAGQLYLQTASGFVKKTVTDFSKYAFNDVTVAFFFDCDQDGDKDLFTGGGGNFSPASADIYQNTIFLNDGKGNFSLKAGALPISHTNCGAAIPLDYDGDGKLDLFIGSRSEPQNYGVAPHSFLYHNEGNGVFKETTEQVAPSIAQLGMITSAKWCDINGDKK
ncbi:MAG: ASPIC/UnbV domain-containing, partial [Chitinophagaceae bacterium]